jgi:hypothetical protein
LVRDVLVVHFDEANLDLMISDLLASNRMSRNSSRKKGHKPRDGRHNNSKRVIDDEMNFLEYQRSFRLG